MAFKESNPDFKMIDVNLIDPDPAHPRKAFDEATLKGLANSIKAKGLIQPVVVQPENGAGRHVLIVGERRWRAAVMAGETAIPALIRACEPEEAIEIQVFENLGQGVRSPLEKREMANAIQAIANRFESREAAAEHLGRAPSWVAQATAVANLSPKVTALLESGQISSCTTALQLDKLAQKDEAKADTLIEKLQEGEKLSKEELTEALSGETGKRGKKKAEDAAIEADAPPAPGAAEGAVETVSPMATANGAPSPQVQPQAQATAPAGRRVSPNKVRVVAEILGLSDGDEDEVLARLIDEFLRLNGKPVEA